MLQLCVTAHFYVENNRKIHPLGVRACRPKDAKRERPGPLAPLFIRLLPPGLPYVNWASQECCLPHSRSSSGPRGFLCSIFVGFSLPCLLATAILDSCLLFYLPDNRTLVCPGLPYFTWDDSAFFPEAVLGIISYFSWLEILHCVHVPHPLFPFMCFCN